MSLWKVNDNYLLWLKAIQVYRDSSGMLVFSPVYTPLVRILKNGVYAVHFKLWGSAKCFQVTLWPKLKVRNCRRRGSLLRKGDFMNVLCSAGRSPVKEKGELETGECLECALETSCPPCGFDYSFLRAVFNGNEDRRSEIHVTDITGCLRKAYLFKKAPVPEPVHSRFYASYRHRRPRQAGGGRPDRPLPQRSAGRRAGLNWPGGRVLPGTRAGAGHQNLKVDHSVKAALRQPFLAGQHLRFVIGRAGPCDQLPGDPVHRYERPDQVLPAQDTLRYGRRGRGLPGVRQ